MLIEDHVIYNFKNHLMKPTNPVLDLSFQFALDIIDYADILEEKKKFVISKQLMRSGTSIGANVREAQSCESRLDFIHKFKIAAKEAEETEYWLQLCKYSKKYPDDEALLIKIIEIKKILSKIISTAKNNLTN
jgi:four helix bundle protein